MFINLDQNHKHKLTDLREDMNPKPKKKNQKKKKMENSVHQGSIFDLGLLLGLSLSQTTKISDDRRWFQPSMSRPKPRTSLSNLTSVLLLGKYQPPRDESESEGGSVSEWECGGGWLGETVWLSLRENEVRALRDIRASGRERRLELREVQRNENRVKDLGFAISEIYIYIYIYILGT